MRPGSTIVATATPPGVAALSIIRLSGPLSAEILGQLTPRSTELTGSPGQIKRLKLRHKQQLLDEAMGVFFKAPQSSTGEDVAELYLHGNPLIVSQVLTACQESGAELAAPGEFTERAYLNGKLDLSQAEAVADIVHAESELQLHAARTQLGGAISRVVDELGEPLRTLMVNIEAWIDFPEEDIEPGQADAWIATLKSLRARIHELTRSYQHGRVIREGAVVAIVGIPNAGKSSLLNRLLGRERAIVTDVAGTTRDTLEERLQISGLSVRLIDTAGIETSVQRELSQVEALGIERSWQAVEEADLTLLLFDPTQDAQVQQELFAAVTPRARRAVIVSSKSDIEPSARIEGIEVTLSSATGGGLQELKSLLSLQLLAQEASAGAVLITSARHFEALTETELAIERALALLQSKDAVELVATEIRAALVQLEDIIGVTTSEELLGRIFSQFCIGK